MDGFKDDCTMCFHSMFTLKLGEMVGHPIFLAPKPNPRPSRFGALFNCIKPTEPGQWWRKYVKEFRHSNFFGSVCRGNGSQNFRPREHNHRLRCTHMLFSMFFFERKKQKATAGFEGPNAAFFGDFVRPAELKKKCVRNFGWMESGVITPVTHF